MNYPDFLNWLAGAHGNSFVDFGKCVIARYFAEHLGKAVIVSSDGFIQNGEDIAEGDATTRMVARFHDSIAEGGAVDLDQLYDGLTPLVGVVSEGTLRLEDLIPKFRAILRNYHPASPALDCDDWDQEYLGELIDALNEISRIGTHFGAHEGDGACFGFWPNGEEGE